MGCNTRPSVDTHRLVSHDVGMTTRAERTWRPWKHEGDERTPLISHEGRASQALRLGNLRRIVVAVCGLAGLVALACVYVPAWRDAEVESKISSALGKQGTQSPRQCSSDFSGTTIFSLNNHESPSRVDLSKDGTIKWNNGAKGHHWMSLSGIYISNGRQLLPLSNGWRHYNAPGGEYAPAEYSCAGGLVAVSGLVRAGNYNSPIGTLPSGCRPKKNLIFSVNNSAKQARVDVYTDGTIKWVAGGKDGGWVSLSGIVFSTTTDAVLPLSNGWRHYSAPPNGYWAPAEYSCAEGLVVVSGLVSAGNWNSPIGTLPSGCRPKNNLIFSVNNHAKQARVDVYTDGTIKWVAGGKDHGWVSLSGIVFSTTTATTDALLPLSNGWRQYNDPPNGYWAPAQVHCARGLTVVQGLIKGGSWSATMAAIPRIMTEKEETISHIPTLASKTLRDIKMLGSHDAGTGYFAGATSFREGSIVTQMTDLVTQANCGVRAFDFRIGAIKNTNEDNKETVLFHHGGFFVDTKGSEVTLALASLVKWANEHPSELLVLMLKSCRTCEKCDSSSIPACDEENNGCKEFSGNDAMQQTRLMKPFKDNRIQIHPDIDCKGENMASITKKSKVPGGGHILVTPQGCFDDNWDPIKKLYWEGPLDPVQNPDPTSIVKGPWPSTFKVLPYKLDKLYTYFHASIKRFTEKANLHKPYWLQAHWQQISKVDCEAYTRKFNAPCKDIQDQGFYAVGLRDDMVEATTNSKINYHVLKKLQDDGDLRANVNVMTMNEVCHAGPEIAQLLGTTVSAADKAKCRKKCEAQDIGNRFSGETCSKDGQCVQDKCGFTQAGDDAAKCCPKGQTTLKKYGTRDYCTPFPDGAKCWSDEQCKSGYCPGNGSGVQKGTCVKKHSKKKGDACVSNAECISKACGRTTAASGAKTQCCEHGYTTFGGYDYCTKMPDGAVCWSDAMCSGVCKGNHGGLARGKCFTLYSRADNAKCSSNDECRSRYCRSGKCFTKKGDWASCPAQNSYCRKGNCNRTTRHGNYKCCPRGTFWCGPWTSGDCKSGFYYCKGKLGH